MLIELNRRETHKSFGVEDMREREKPILADAY
jgi:hypothetical protein